MDQQQFWDVIAKACRFDPHSAEEWADNLEAALKRFEPEEIIEWNHLFDRLAVRAYTVDLWGAAYLINGGASDDGFYYFRCWLIGMGKTVYEAALASPDNLADYVETDEEREAEIYSVACRAWEQATG